MSKDIFIDPSPVTPRDLNHLEMSQIQGGFAPIVWVTTCFENFAAGVTLTIVTVVS